MLLCLVVFQPHNESYAGTQGIGAQNIKGPTDILDKRLQIPRVVC